jgi:hypothetical protein
LARALVAGGFDEHIGVGRVIEVGKHLVQGLSTSTPAPFDGFYFAGQCLLVMA